MNAQQSYESNMRVIGYLYNTLKDNYGTMQVEDFNELSGQISRLFQQSCDLLPSANPEPRSEPEPEPEPEPAQHTQYAPFNRVRSEMGTQNAFHTPPPAQQSQEPPPIERNRSQWNVTMTRGSNIVDLSLPDDLPMTMEELNDDENDDDWAMDDTEEYQDYISYKIKPKLTTKCFTKKEGREKTSECVICCEEYDLHQTLTLGCGHDFCKECVCDHFHHSVENQPYKRFYACPICRADVKQVRVNYSKINAKHKGEIMASPLVNHLKTWCK